MASQEELARESRLLILRGSQASEALACDFMNQTGHYVLMTPNLYSEVRLGQGWMRGSVCSVASVGPYACGIDAFVKGALKNDECRALIPLTDGVKSVLKERCKLIVVPIGFRLEPEGIRFEGYKK